VLKRFPLEAGIAPNFDVLDETGSDKMLSEALQHTLADTSFAPDIALVSQYLDESGIEELLSNILNDRFELVELLRTFTTFDALQKNIKRYFDLEKFGDENDIIRTHFTLEEWPLLVQKYIKKTDGQISHKHKDDPMAALVFETSVKIKEYKIYAATLAMLHLFYSILKTYDAQKKKQACLDYDDLIHLTRALLEKSDMAPWVLYKLDGGLDHILVDEAQDTNPNQWSIIRMLSEEFFAGETGKENRTVFAVGDKKQSIYSFQGADPMEFEKMRLFFMEKAAAAQKTFDTVPLNLSFRSTRPILDVVNYVLDHPAAKHGVLLPGEEAVHLAWRESEAGSVEIWPLEAAEKTDEIDGWKPPVEKKKHISAIARLSAKIAGEIKKMLDSGDMLPSKGRPVRAGDFLILVQRRGALTHELVRCLKEFQIPVAGLDRLQLTGHIAVQDLLAILRFCLLPQDDLNLACLFKSPFLNLSEDDLFKAAHARGDQNLWDRVQHLFPQTAGKLHDIRRRADATPFEFFSFILGPMGLRRNFMARMGDEVRETLDEFLNLCLEFEKNETPSLFEFLSWIEEKEVEIKRDAETEADAVRIMTVHGAKGLQGNIVFLPDTRYMSKKPTPFIWSETKLPIWVPKTNLKTDRLSGVYETIEENRQKEYRRLLYVALTRAADRLYVCGYENKTAAPAGNWYDLVCAALPHVPDADGVIRIHSPQQTPAGRQTSPAGTISETPVLPDWATKPAPREAVSSPLAPSRQLDDMKTTEPLSFVQEKAMRRGVFIHQLLELLPAVDPQKRREVAIKLKPADIDLPDNLFQIFSDPTFSKLFCPSSIGEVPVAGQVDGQIVSGQIDRLAVLENEVLVVDFKTNIQVPKEASQVPETYKKQLGLYKKLLNRIFPDKIVKTYILWVTDLTWIEL
jgi:ATP-dependent helicase/nuclease subunit A